MKHFGLEILGCGFLLLMELGVGNALGSDFSSAARGTTAAEFLELGVGARAVGMGEAYSAVADEASALYWNPAAMSNIPGRSATFMHAPYINTSFFDYGAYVQNLGARGTLGAGIQYFSAGSVTQTDATGTDVGAFTPYDLAATLGYAFKLNAPGPAMLDGASVGIAGKFIQSRLLTNAQTAAFDFGALSPIVLDGKVRLAFTLTNLGGTMKFDATNENLPLALRFGSYYKITNRWISALDIAFPRNDDPYVAVGTEYQLFASGPWRFAGRAGFNSQTLNSIDGFTGITFGVGIGYDRLAVDYGFVPLGGIGQAHRISLTLGF